MKPARMALITAAALVVLAGPAAADEPPDFVDLTPRLEKWFQADEPQKTIVDRMRTLVAGSFDGGVLQTREYYQGETIVRIERLLFSRTADGDVLYLGDPLARLDAPVVWVDMPLEVGKAWTGLAQRGAEVRHYVFAVVDERMVDCPMGTYLCHHVFVAAVTPEGLAHHDSFWYNPACGLVRCLLDGDAGYALLKAQILDGPDVPDVRPHEDPGPVEAGLVSGLTAGPNPFNPATVVRFDLARSAPVTVEIFDLAGHRVRTLVRAEVHAAGPCAFPWDGRDGAGRDVASGAYVARVRAGGTTASGRMTLVR